MRRTITALLLSTVITAWTGMESVAAALGADDDGAAIISQYVAAAQRSSESLRGMRMSAEIRASRPKLNRSGGMKATRTVSLTGQVTYSGSTFDGDEDIKRDVIARYLQAEAEASKQPSLGMSQANYKFKYWGVYGSGDWQLHLFEVTPRRKAQGLWQGWLWIDTKTNLPVREQGRLVKNPTVFFKRVDFVRDFDISSGLARPSLVESTITTRVAGVATIAVEYRDYQAAADAVTTAARYQEPDPRISH